jgi:predicted amidophosphoribosyltransferase
MKLKDILKIRQNKSKVPTLEKHEWSETDKKFIQNNICIECGSNNASKNSYICEECGSKQSTHEIHDQINSIRKRILEKDNPHHS